MPIQNSVLIGLVSGGVPVQAGKERPTKVDEAVELEVHFRRAWVDWRIIVYSVIISMCDRWISTIDR